MVKIDTVYFDMDGVLVDQVRALAYVEGITEQQLYQDEMRLRATKGKTYSHVMALIRKHLHSKQHFISANSTPEFHEFYELMKYWLSRDIHVKILSSSTKQEDLYDEICRQKHLWLDRHNVHMIPRIFTKGSSAKKEYARPGAILIDDFHENILDFNEGGGIGVHHVDPRETFARLKELELIP